MFAEFEYCMGRSPRHVMTRLAGIIGWDVEADLVGMKKTIDLEQSILP